MRLSGSYPFRDTALFSYRLQVTLELRFWLTRLLVVQVFVHARLGNKFIVRPPSDHSTVIQHENSIGTPGSRPVEDW